VSIASRFQVVEKPKLYPHYDIVDNTPDGECFDLGLDLDNYEGIVYIKVAHVMEMARVLGMISKEEADILRARNQELEANQERLPEKLEGFLNGINDLVAEYRSLDAGDSLASDVPSDIFDEESSTGSVGTEERASESVNRNSVIESGESDSDSGNAKAGNGQKPKPAVGKRSDSVSADSSHEFGFDLGTGTS
jgi:hypothetical protein